MVDIKLEVGKTYEVRSPEIALIEGHSPIIKIIDQKANIYIGDDGYHYLNDGRVDLLQLSPFDLVREVNH